MYNRSMFYFSKLISHTILKGRQYENIPEAILINILDYEMFDDDIGYRYFSWNEMDFYKGKLYHNINGNLFDEELNTVKNKEKKRNRNRY